MISNTDALIARRPGRQGARQRPWLSEWSGTERAWPATRRMVSLTCVRVPATPRLTLREMTDAAPSGQMGRPVAARGKYDRTAEALAKEAQVPNYMLKKSVRDELAARGITYSQYLAEKKTGRRGQKTEDDTVGSGTDLLAPGEGQAGREICGAPGQGCGAAAERRASPGGIGDPLRGQDHWGTLFYYTTPDGDGGSRRSA